MRASLPARPPPSPLPPPPSRRPPPYPACSRTSPRPRGLRWSGRWRDQIRSRSSDVYRDQYGFETPFRVTSGLQARVPRTHATCTKQDCGAAGGEVWQHTTTHKRSLFIKQDRARPPGCAMFACAYRVCSCADGQAASIHARLHRAVRTAQGDAGRHSGCHLRRCKRRQGANRQEAGGRDCRSKRFGARAARRELPRGEKGGVHTAWRAGSGPAEAARQAGMWGREGGEGFASSLPRLPAPAGKG